MPDYLEWIREFVSRRAGSLPENASTVNYLEAGLIDSFGVVEMLGEIEERFGVALNETHFEDSRFVIMEGLAQIVAENAGQAAKT
ncbi:MAG: acyl carrier protein [Pyrinomonadaceae bacterium]